MSQLDSFLRTWEEEFQRTLRVFNAYPADRMEYRPHEKSNTARNLMWTIIAEEEAFIDGCLRGKITFGASKPPETKEALIREYNKRHKALVNKLKKAGEEFLSRTIKFYVAKGKIGDLKIGYLLWEVLHDQIHHRGQLSVYLRLVGAKVPSIYGPSADEPW